MTRKRRVTQRDDFQDRFEELKDRDFVDLVLGDPHKEPDPPLLDLLAAALMATDEVDYPDIPDQRPVLKQLHEAVYALHPTTVYEIFDPDGAFDADIGQIDLINKIDRVIEALPITGRAEKTRERAIVAALAEAFQQHSGLPAWV